MNRMNLRPLALLISGLLLAGCSQTPYRGHGEYFELAQRNVVERDLSAPGSFPLLTPTLQQSARIAPKKPVNTRQSSTPPPSLTKVLKQNRGEQQTPALKSPLSVKVTKTASINPTPVKLANVTKITTPPVKAKPAPVFVMTKGQSYIKAIRRWLKDEGHKRVAWSLPQSTLDALAKTVAEPRQFTGSLKAAIVAIGKEIEQPMRLDIDSHKGLAAVHALDGSVHIQLVSGSTLKAAIGNLVTGYGWRWGNDDTPHPSWMPADDYPQLGDFPIVTARGDIDIALNTVLDGYPLQAQLLYATQQVFIVEKE